MAKPELVGSRFLVGPNLFSQTSVLVMGLQPDPKLVELAERSVESLVEATFRVIGEGREGDALRAEWVAVQKEWNGAEHRNLGAWVALLAICLQRVVGLPVRTFGGKMQAGGDRWLVVFEWRERQAAAIAGLLAWRIVRRALLAEDQAPPLSDSELGQVYDKITEARTTRYLRPLIEVADRRGIPWHQEHPHFGLAYFGWGCRRQRAFETIPEGESLIGSFLTRDKSRTVETLRQARLPVPDQQVVGKAEQAIKAAEHIGYPVVVKPLAYKKSRGVTIDLRTSEEVKEAFAEANRYGPNVLVESYFDGDVFRLLVVDQRLVCATRRVPTYVLGDGKRTIRELAEQSNSSGNRGKSERFPQKPIPADMLEREAPKFLARSGRSLDSVPDSGETVFLSKIPRFDWGSSYADVTELVHPDNSWMATQAASLLGLKVTGIDFICPDISRSYREGSSAITDVNLSPSILLHRFANPEAKVAEPIMDCLFPSGDDGRIPIVAVFGDAASDALLQTLATVLSRAGHIVGTASKNGVTVGDQLITREDLSTKSSFDLLFLDPHVSAAVLVIRPEAIEEYGLGFDLCDVSVFAGNSEIGQSDEHQRLIASAQLLARSTRGRVILDADDAALTPHLLGTAGDQLCLLARDSAQLSQSIEPNANCPVVMLERLTGETILTYQARAGDESGSERRALAIAPDNELAILAITAIAMALDISFADVLDVVVGQPDGR